MSIKSWSRVGIVHQTIWPLLWAGSSAVPLGPHSVPGPVTLSVTITRNPKAQESCSPKLKAGRCCWQVLLRKLAYLCISCLILLIGLEYLFTFSVDSLAHFSPSSLMLSFSHQPRASEVKKEDWNTISPIWMLAPEKNNKSQPRYWLDFGVSCKWSRCE